jgi:predicted transcriptional regulator
VYLYGADNVRVNKTHEECAMNGVAVSGKKERLHFLLSPELAKRTEQTANALDSSVSELLRRALEDFIERHEQERIEEELEAGYKANAPYYAKMIKEWEFADSE